MPLSGPVRFPVQVEIDLGDTALAKNFAPRILTGLQKSGWKVGPSKFIIKLTTSAVDSNEEIEFMNSQRITVPMIVYTSTLLDDQGRILSQGSAASKFDIRKTKYRTEVDLETRRVTGDDAINFRGKDPKVAILEEILESGEGLDQIGPPVPTMLNSGNRRLPLPGIFP